MFKNLSLLLSLVSSVAMAGGSWESVTVRSLELVGETTYELVVIPKHQSDDVFMKDCPAFKVIGTYAWLHSWRFSNSVTRKNHKAALMQLKEAQKKGKTILFGWMGAGFVPVDPTYRCVVRSRALEWVEENGTRAIVSYHDPI